ncbi:hypothetical protein [Rubripirellula reticaptiva]|nr:hypothetical protein [Rubripirellula reticaptiva]
MAIGISMCLLVATVVPALLKRETIDWWSALTLIPVITVWCVGITMKYLA